MLSTLGLGIASGVGLHLLAAFATLFFLLVLWLGERVGASDGLVIELNKEAFASLRCKKEMKIIPGATHLFEEPDALEQVARLAAEWFKEHLQAQPRTSAASG